MLYRRRGSVLLYLLPVFHITPRFPLLLEGIRQSGMWSDGRRGYVTSAGKPSPSFPSTPTEGHWAPCFIVHQTGLQWNWVSNLELCGTKAAILP
ncbi:hypothetical protein AVEN_86941-1 [Araneus ventricosus]|uniref:Uncharacterized protein n=1 Tax=Araneus ventricosus TaxID=182803 RepID=A0A4Y2WPZ1_ARAVE|nr:hypothetical protein AVEN_198412-1 [Araneus ventricosus]GBO39239.1 hypothetical protein AVEN_86941-1 [Araneus ventricosus]